MFDFNAAAPLMVGDVDVNIEYDEWLISSKVGVPVDGRIARGRNVRHAHAAVDHHRVGGPVHVEPGSVGGGHRLATHCCT